MLAPLAVATALVAVPALVGATPDPTASQQSSAQTRGVDDDVAINQIQTIGSHNSYHLLPSEKEAEIRRSFIGAGDQLMTYQHAPLPTQFASQKVRQIELDIFLDPSGGKYADPLLRSVAGDGPMDPIMNTPGIKVLHVQDVDYRSSCLTLVQCLEQVKGWSDANSSHVPIAILLELKDEEVPFDGFSFEIPDPWTASGMDTLDDEIRSVFGPDQVITPDDVRGSHATLEEAVLSDGWPTLGDSRGKVMFLMDNGGGYRSDYLAGHPSLQGRMLFTNASPGNADAAFVKENDATKEARIRSLVEAGYVVRTRADGDTREARTNDTTLRDAALRSGAQWVSTDYPMPGMAVGFTTSYSAQIPGGTVARCNPVNGPATCVSAELDTIFTPIDPPVAPTTITLPDETRPNPPAGTPPATGPGGVGQAPGATPVATRPAYTG
ncbi:MAG: phosphatidylinositol-specific phospholipase C1-like protein [Aquihabitans sp.]